MRSRPGRASAHPPNPRAMAAGPPRCPCDKHVLAQLKTTDMRDRWAAREGISWSQYRGSAFFHFCHECHNSHWPADIRGARGNRHTRPRDADPMAGATKRTASGELFYLTAPAPEFLSVAVRQQAKRFRAAADAAEAARVSVPPAFGLSSRHECKASTGGLLRPRRVGQRPLAQQSLTFVDGLGCTAPRPGSKAEKAALAVPMGRYPRENRLPEYAPLPLGGPCDGCGHERSTRCMNVQREDVLHRQKDLAFLCTPCQAELLANGCVFAVALEVWVSALAPDGRQLTEAEQLTRTRFLEENAAK
jgi:hypothetical protein